MPKTLDIAMDSSIFVEIKKAEKIVTQIHQIEVTTFCNLKCDYCPSPNLPRKKMFMDMEIFERSLEWVKHYIAKGTQGEVSLTGIGESFMHPKIVEMIAKTREAIGDLRLVIATNGILLSDEMCKKIKQYSPEIWVSMHDHEPAKKAINLAKIHGIYAGLNNSAQVSSFNWAGQVKWNVSAPRCICSYLDEGWGVIMAGGMITTCCLDASGAGIIGHVNDSIADITVKPYNLCESCHMEVPR